MDVQEGARRRITWTPRLAAGVGLAGACLLLWPFAEWDWIPLAVAVGLLVLLRLLRLDGLLFGWAPHVAGLVVLVLLILRTGPWEWALAISLAVLLAGITQWPRWHLLAVGGALVIVSTTGYVITQLQVSAAEEAQRDARSNLEASSLQLEEPGAVVRAVMRRIASEPTVPDSAARACAYLTDAARAQFAASVEAPDCLAAVSRLSAGVTDRNRYAEPVVPPSAVVVTAGSATVDACRATWAPGDPPGPALGRFTLSQLAGPGRGWQVTGYAACS